MNRKKEQRVSQVELPFGGVDVNPQGSASQTQRSGVNSLLSPTAFPQKLTRMTQWPAADSFHVTDRFSIK